MTEVESLVLTDARCLDHVVPPDFPERPERLGAIATALRASGREVTELQPDVRVQELARTAAARTHDAEYLQRLDEAFSSGAISMDSSDNPLSAGTAAAAWAALETTLTAAERVLAGAPHAFALIRPPGHHCERSHAMGFCYLANAAILADHLQNEHGLGHIAIVDFDVHHGNGTQHLFEDRADVLYASLHQAPFYPGTGAASERGSGRGVGATVNAPLPAGSGDAEVLEALEKTLLPAVCAHRPEFIIASAGFDAWQDDPLGGFHVTAAGYQAIGRELATVGGAASCRGMVSVLEGGYDVPALGELVEAYLDGIDSMPSGP